MNIFTAEQFREAERITLEKNKISSLDLMERAATLLFKEIDSSLKGAATPIKIFCGIGKNGGDGLVIARLLKEKKYQVKVFVVNHSDKRSDEFLANYERIKKLDNNWPEILKNESGFPMIAKNDFVIDAIFGIGLNRPVESWVGKLLEHINNSGAFVLSVDMPSGLYTDKIPAQGETVISADVTFTFQAPKLVFFLPETAAFVGDFFVLDIGLDREFLKQTETEVQLIGKFEVVPFYRNRNRFSHKGTFGHSLVVGGSHGKMGSVLLASTGALKAGAGKVTAMVPQCGYEILQIGLPEAMVLTSPEEKFLSPTELDFEPEVICFGMGAGKSPQTINAFEEILKKNKKPMVIDADGLNILSENKELLKSIPAGSVLTPHPKELEGIIGIWKDDFDKLEKAKEFSEKYEVALVIKGAYTMTVDRKNMYINNSGNAGMATAGSGDVLAGIITGLVSQGYNPLSAAILGVYLHGIAGDMASEQNGMDSLMAGDISNYLGRAFLFLFQKSKVDNTGDQAK